MHVNKLFPRLKSTQLYGLSQTPGEAHTANNTGKLFKLFLQELKEYRDGHHESGTDQRASSADRLVAATSGLSVGESDVSSDSSQHADVMRRIPCHPHSEFSQMFALQSQICRCTCIAKDRSVSWL